MNNTIYLRRKNKIEVSGDNKSYQLLPNDYLATGLKNIESLGYTFSSELIQALRFLNAKEFVELYTQTVKDLKSLLGATTQYKPMYPNFPKQVMDAEESELYINAVVHYVSAYFHDITGGEFPTLLPKYVVKERFPLLDKTNLKVIGLGNQKEFNQILSNLVSANTSLSEQDKEDISWFVEHGEGSYPNQIPNKENLAFTFSEILKYNRNPSVLSTSLKTATDVLRLAVAMSSGDVSLAEPCKFKKFIRKERRMLLGFLENCKNVEEDMVRFSERWKRLGYMLHVGDYKTQFPNTNKAIQKIQSGESISTFNSQVEHALEYKVGSFTSNLLKTRPGEFARRLDHLLRNSVLEETESILKDFRDVADKVSTPVLLQVMTHFKNRNSARSLRVFFPKGNVAKVQAIENNLPDIPSAINQRVTQVCHNALFGRFSQLPPLGKVYLDESLKDYLVPFSQRSASRALKTIVRGSQLPLPIGDTVRFFIHWKNTNGRIDIDLSGVILGENFQHIETLSYYNLKGLGGHHSGDITDAPKGASEFIDLDMNKVSKMGGRYIVMSVNSFTSQVYKDIDECFAGWMIRQHPDSGEIYEPKTVQNKFDLTSDTKIAIPLIIDVAERKVIWTDLALKSNPGYVNNVAGNLSGTSLMLQAMTQLVKPNLYDLFRLHALSRCTRLVEDKSQADTVFSVDSGITPFDFDTIAGEYLQ